jgi:hypothetical protein
MRFTPNTVNILAAVLVSIASVGITPAQQPAGVGLIWAYAGTWKTETENLDTAHSKASHEKATLRNSCWKDGAYVACNQYVDGDSKILLVFTYNEADKTYTSYQIPQGGGSSGNGKLLIDGNVWTFPWDDAEGGVTTYYRVVNTWPSVDRIEYRKEFSTDKVHWTLMAKGVETRVSHP